MNDGEIPWPHMWLTQKHIEIIVDLDNRHAAFIGAVQADKPFRIVLT